eukprot:228639-Rhodomonas_salina.2
MSGAAAVRASASQARYGHQDTWGSVLNPACRAATNYFRLIWTMQQEHAAGIQHVTIVHPSLQRDDKDPDVIEDVYGETRWSTLRVTHLEADLFTTATDGSQHCCLWCTLDEIKTAAIPARVHANAMRDGDPVEISRAARAMVAVRSSAPERQQGS